MVANELALSNLRFGNTVTVDCVNPVIESKKAWSDFFPLSGDPVFTGSTAATFTSGRVVPRISCRSESLLGMVQVAPAEGYPGAAERGA